MSRYTSEQTAYSYLKKKYVPLWKRTASCYQKSVLSGEATKMLVLENCFIYMAREAVFECMVYI